METKTALVRFTFLAIAVLYSFATSSFTPHDLISAPRTGPAIPNPNATMAVCTQSEYSFQRDGTYGGLYLLTIDSKSSSSATLIVNDTRAHHPIWLDDRTILYIYTQKGKSCLKTFNVASKEETDVISFLGAIADLQGLILDSKTVRFAFSAKVTPRGDIGDANETEVPDALVYDKLWVRHWDEWSTPTRYAIFSGTLILQDGKYVIGDSPRNMLNGSLDFHDLECPVPPFGGTEDFSLSKRYLAFVSKDPHLNPATNTAAHIYVVALNDSTFVEQINRGPGASSSPVWSPDGKVLAYLEMRVKGYESDRKAYLVLL